MDILLTLLIGLLIIGLIALIGVFKFDKFMGIKNNIFKKNSNDKEIKK